MKDIFVVMNTKGGVAKTTTSAHFITPFLYEKINEKTKEKQKVKYFEVDRENNSSGAFKKSEIFEQTLLQNGLQDFEQYIAPLMVDFTRDYPIIIDVGMSHVEEVLQSISLWVSDEKIHYIIPTRASEQDYINTRDTIKKIQDTQLSPNIIVFCSEAIAAFDETKELRKEFGITFGEYINSDTGVLDDSLFKETNIDEKFLSIKKNRLFIEAGKTYKTTIYEASQLGKSLLNLHDLTEDNVLVKEKKALEKKILVAQKANDLEQLKELKNLNFAQAKKRVFYKDCSIFSQKHLEGLFRSFEMLL